MEGSQWFIIGIVSSVGVLKMGASDWIVLWTMCHLFIPFYSTHSEGKVVPVVFLETLLLFSCYHLLQSPLHHHTTLAQSYLESTINDLSMMDMGECKATLLV